MWRKKILFFGALVLFAGALMASDYDKRTVIKFNEPIMVAGVPVVTLAPGTYVVRLMNHDHNRNIVQFLNEREDHLYTTVLAFPKVRLDPASDTEFSFWETPTGNPPALRSWFSIGDRTGQEFVYPKGLAAKLAHDAGKPVLTTEAKNEAEMLTAPIGEVNAAGEERRIELAVAAPTPAPVPAPAPTPAPQAVTAAPAPAPQRAAEPAKLPATASPFFTIGLLGLLTLGAGIALKKVATGRV